jgi:hypothetical protein
LADKPYFLVVEDDMIPKDLGKVTDVVSLRSWEQVAIIIRNEMLMAGKKIVSVFPVNFNQRTARVLGRTCWAFSHSELRNSTGVARSLEKIHGSSNTFRILTYRVPRMKGFGIAVIYSKAQEIPSFEQFQLKRIPSVPPPAAART